MTAAITPEALRRGSIATTRFGLGPRPGEIAEAARDPRGWVLGQLTPQPLPASFAGLPTGTEATAAFQEMRRAMTQPGAVPAGEPPRATYQREAGARLRVQVETATPVIERLVAFWSNHFTVSVIRPPVLTLAGPFEREAIRPHVLGRFEDMLLAASRHQAMLLYLDNAASIGPGSRIGQARERGLNENLAREILELHALGVNGGYAQEDVRALALLITGWSIARQQEPAPGSFRFRPQAHEPGSKTLLGKDYAQGGEAEGLQALRDLAHHPATANHIATKLARHFIADDPPKHSVDRLAQVYQRTGGDLLAVTRALVEDQATWTPATKVRAPNELVIAALRGLSAKKLDDRPTLGALRRLGQAPYAAPSPAGWPDVAAEWIGPEAVMRRIEWASALAARVAADRAPMELFDATIGPIASIETRLAVERAPSARDGIALVFAAPEFQRR